MHVNVKFHIYVGFLLREKQIHSDSENWKGHLSNKMYLAPPLDKTASIRINTLTYQSDVIVSTQES